MGADTQPRWREMTAAEREDAYSPSTMVGGDLGPFIASYAEQSRRAYATCPDLQTLHYGQAETQTLDLVVPQGAGPHPLHVFVHGGYWQALSKKESFFAAPGTLAQGIAFSAVDYTLAPDAALGEIVDEIISAIRFLIMQSDAYGLDPTRVVISGSSAGAHLAAMATLRLGASERPAGLMLLSGIYDLRPLVGTYINDAIGMDDKSAAALSPALCDLSGFPPSVVAWGDNETDEFKRQSLHFAELLQQAGCATDTREVAGRNHFDIVHDIASGSALGGWLARLARPKEH